MGLPSVCLPHAVDGLEDVAASFARVATNGAEFTRACIELLTSESGWSELSQRARVLAQRRFSDATVYRELDNAMGWARNADERRLLPAPPAALHMGLRMGLEDPLEIPNDPISAIESSKGDSGATAALGFRLAQIGQMAFGRSLLERAAIDRPGDPFAAHMAATIALQDGDGWQAAMHASVIVAQRPAEAEGYYLLGQGLAASGQTRDAVDAFSQALALSPSDHRIRNALIDASRKSNRDPGLAAIEPIVSLDCRLDEQVFLNLHRLGNNRLGPGWSWPEAWGSWTDGQRARINLRLVDPMSGGQLVIFGKAAGESASESQSVAVVIDGHPVGRWDVPMDGAPHLLAIPVPDHLLNQRDSLAVELLIGRPQRIAQNGQVVDTRKLGLAVEWLAFTQDAITDEPASTAETAETTEPEARAAKRSRRPRQRA